MYIKKLHFSHKTHQRKLEKILHCSNIRCFTKSLNPARCWLVSAYKFFRYVCFFRYCSNKFEFLFFKKKFSHLTNLFSGHKNGRLPYLKHSRYQVLGWIHLPHFGSVRVLQTTHPLTSGQGFLYFFTNLLPFLKVESCTEDTTKFWKIIKNVKNLAKREEKPCPKIYLSSVKYLRIHKWGRWIRPWSKWTATIPTS